MSYNLPTRRHSEPVMNKTVLLPAPDQYVYCPECLKPIKVLFCKHCQKRYYIV